MGNSSVKRSMKKRSATQKKVKHLPKDYVPQKWHEVYLELEDWGLCPPTIRVDDTEPFFVIRPGAYATWKPTYGPYDMHFCMLEAWEKGRESEYLIGMGGYGCNSWEFAAIRREARALVGFQTSYGGIYNDHDKVTSNVNECLKKMDQISLCLSDPSIQAALPKGDMLVAILRTGKGRSEPQYALAKHSDKWEDIRWIDGNLDPSNLLQQLSALHGH